ncbi:matrixin family metalloprotease, partial [Marine Group I thaumarchaeote]|nr:matrixin family metalloprotease [Marine Group I thaumarchaeote]
WVKEFGTGIGGHAINQWFIEVELGTDALHTTWQPYSINYVGYILTHEIGHTLGVRHNNDPNNIMYKTAIPVSFGLVEINKQVQSGYGSFFPFHSSTNSADFVWRVESDDQNHGFDVYVVSSRDALVKWAANKSFSYYSDDGCFAKDMLTVGGICNNVGKSSGLMVLMGSGFTDPRVSDITVTIYGQKIFNPLNLNIPTIQKQSTPTPTSTTQQTQQQTQQSKGGGCLIATAAFGSEMAPQVQFLRELRDNTVLQTESGTSFMTGFNQFYYSFSPAIADYERENPVFKEAVKLTLTPLLTSLTLLQYADIDSESEMLGYGIGIILLNIGMYFVVPAILVMKVRKKI